MANNPSVSEVLDKDGIIADIEAKRFDGTRTFTLQGDVSGTQTWNGDSSTAMTLNVSIGAKKVTQDKINDKAVGTAQLGDDAVTLDKIADAAMNGTVQDNDSKLATHSSVKTYVDSMISGQGTYLGKKTVAEVNAMVTANLHNGDRVMLSDSGTINLGPGGVGFDVRVGADLILYSVGSDTHWDLMDGEFKTKQTAISGGQGSTTKTLTGIGQNANGEIDPAFSDIQEASTSQKGLVQLAGSVGATIPSENNRAASEKAVRDALDALETDIQSGYKPKQTAVTDPTASGNSYSFIASYSQDANGVSTVEKKTVPDASASTAGVGGAKGLMSAADKEKLDGITDGANKVEASQTNGNIKIDGAETTVYTHPTNGANVSKGDTTAQTPGFGGTFKVLSATVDSMGHTTSLGEHTVTIPDTAATPSTDGVGGSAGLMSAADKEKLDDLASGEATSDKDEVIAAALDDLDARMGAVEDSLKEENLGTRTADEIDSQVLKIGGDDVSTLIAGKVDKVEGKGLSKNDFTDAYKSAVDANTSARHTHSNKSVLDGISSSDITDWNGKQSALTWMTNDEVDALWDNAYAAAVAG